MIVCTKCGFRNPDGTEFCANCGSFLEYVGKKTEALSGGVTLAVEPAVLAVKPGEEASCQVRVRNKSNIVDQYDISVTGEPSKWTLAEPTALSLFPDAEGLAKIRFRPIRSAQLPAGRKTFSIIVQSKASTSISAHQDGAVEVAPFEEATLAVVPRTSRGGASASHRIVVENRGNVPLQATLEAIDVDELLGFRFDNPMVTVPPGQSAYTQLLVEPRSSFPQGPPQPHAFKVQLASQGKPLTATDATMLQEPIAPPPPPPKRRFPVALLLIPLLLLLGIGAVFLAPPLISGAFLANTGATSTPGQSAAPTASTAPTAPTPTPTPVPTHIADVIQCTGPTTMRGTFVYDLERCREVSPGDVWWQQMTAFSRQLTPQNGAMLANMGQVNYDGITLATLKAQSYSATPIGMSKGRINLPPGTVIAVKTRNGQYAKVRIDSYGYNLAVTSTTYEG
jgi:zinc ribbon protein